MGTHVISIGAARFEGSSKAYLDLAYPAVPDWSLAQHLLASGQNGGLDVRLGITATYDAFYPKMAPALAGHSLPDIDELRKARVAALDMETALLYVMGIRLGVPAAAMCLVTNDFSPFDMRDSDSRVLGENALIQAVLGGLLSWHKEC
jgi:uridine phosphorylase